MSDHLDSDTLDIDGLTVEVRYWIEPDPYPIDDIDGRSGGPIVHVEQLWLGETNITSWLRRFNTELFEWELDILEEREHA
jgi:hypothetical protein